jgi:hypothetical protein
MFKTGKRFVSVFIAVIILLSTMTITAFAGVDVDIPLDYYNTGVVTLPSNDYDAYYFTAPTARTYAISFSTGNPNLRAVLFDASLTTVERQFADGAFAAFQLPPGEWCWVIMPITGNVGGAYQLIVNGSNPAGLTSVSATPNLSTVQGYLNGVQYINGVAQYNYTVAINSFSGGTPNITYNQGTRYRIEQKNTLTVNGTVYNGGAPVGGGVSITVLIENKHWSITPPGTIAANTPYRYNAVTVVTNSQGNFTANVTANNAVGSDYVILPGAPAGRYFQHWYDYSTVVHAYPSGAPIPTSGGTPIYIYAYSEIV